MLGDKNGKETSIKNTIVYSPIEPRRRQSEFKGYYNTNSLQIPAYHKSDRKDSIVTSSTINPEGETGIGASGISNRNIEFTPTESKIYTAKQRDPFDSYSSKRIDYYTSDKLTPQPQKYFNQRWNDRQLHYQPSQSTKNKIHQKINDFKSDELMRLKKQNADLKRRLSLKQSCQCKAPYVQEEAEYLRKHFYTHIKIDHPQFFKQSQTKK